MTTTPQTPVTPDKICDIKRIRNTFSLTIRFDDLRREMKGLLVRLEGLGVPADVLEIVRLAEASAGTGADQMSELVDAIFDGSAFVPQPADEVERDGLAYNDDHRIPGTYRDPNRQI